MADYETQTINHWISGNYCEADFHFFRGMAREEIENPSKTSEYWTAYQAVKYSLADRMREYTLDIAMDVVGDSGPFCDILYASLREDVEWDKLAEGLLDGEEFFDPEEES